MLHLLAVSASLERGWTDLALFMFITVALKVFTKKKKLKKLPGKMRNSGKTEVRFFLVTRKN